MGKPNDLVQGTLDLLILKTVSLEPKHGWAIAKRIQQISGDVLQVQQGSLYPALHRLEQKAWIKAKWADTETGRQAKYYSLTAAGRAQLEKEAANWSRLSAAINLVVENNVGGQSHVVDSTILAAIARIVPPRTSRSAIAR
jgi:PadR family transcriptional regulator, regulatory protein PadR